jgi:hypothetical protein
MDQQISWEQVKWMGLSGSGNTAADSSARPCNAIETAMYRLAFSCPEEIGAVRLPVHVSASGRYKLYVNGRAVMYGPCRGGRWERYFESLDLSRWLHPGNNVLAARVVAYPPYEAQRGNQRAPFSFYGNAAGPMLVVRGQLENDRAEILTDVSTGVGNWRVSRDASLGWDASTATLWMGAMEDVDLSQAPEGWHTAPSLPEWAPAEVAWPVTPNGYGEIMPFPLSPRPIPLPYLAEPKPFAGSAPLWSPTGSDPVIPPHQSVTWVLDAGELTTAFFRLPISGGKGSRIQITYAESYTVPGTGRRPEKQVRDDAENGWIQGVADKVLASGRDEVYEPFLFRTFRFVELTVNTASAPLKLGTPTHVGTGYPLQVKTACASARPWTAPIWDMSVRTLARCMQETYTDCPYYEQLQYTMDTRLQMLYTYAAAGDDRLARKAVADFHASLLPEGMLQSRWPSDLPQVIPGFSLHWIFMLHDHWWETGSTELFRRYRPTVDAVLDWFERKTDDTGLAGKLGHWEYVDWVREWEDRAGVPEAVAHGPSATLNLTLAAALAAAAQLMHLTGRPDVAREYEARRARIHTAVEAGCWSPDKGMYQDGPGLNLFSQHTQVWAVLSGLADGERAGTVLKAALEEPGVARCSFPWMYLLFRALEKADLYARTEPLWDMWQALIPQHLTTIPETPFNTRSDCHAWGALPLYEFPRAGLGVMPAEAGWQRVRICPRMLFLQRMSGEVTTPRGLVGVSWEVADNVFSLSVRLPAGVAAEIVLPDGSSRPVMGVADEPLTYSCAAGTGTGH